MGRGPSEAWRDGELADREPRALAEHAYDVACVGNQPPRIGSRGLHDLSLALSDADDNSVGTWGNVVCGPALSTLTINGSITPCPTCGFSRLHLKAPAI